MSFGIILLVNLFLAALMTGCGGGSGSGTTPPIIPPTPPTKSELFVNGFYDIAGAGGTALPAQTAPCVSYAVIRGGSFSNKGRQNTGQFHTSLALSADLADTVHINIYNANGQPASVTTKDHGTSAKFVLTLAEAQSALFDITSTGNYIAQIANTNRTTLIEVNHEYRNSAGMVMSGLRTIAPGKLSANARAVILDEAKHATGACVINPGAQASTVTYTLRNQSGQSVAAATRTYQPGQLFGSPFIDFSEFATALASTFDGTVEMAATAPLVITALSHGSNPFTYFRDHPSASTLENSLIFAQVPNTPDEQSMFELFAGGSPVNYTIKFFNPDGTPRTVKTTTHGTASEFTVNLGANALDWILPAATEDNGSPANSTGYATVTKDQSDAHAELYTSRGNPELRRAPARFSTQQRIAVEKDANSEIELALLNLSGVPTKADLYLIRSDGTEAAMASVIFDRQTSKKLNEIPGLEPLASGFTGTLNILSDVDIAADATRRSTAQNYQTALSIGLETAPARTIQVRPTDDWCSAINGALPGDEVVFAPGNYVDTCGITADGTAAAPIIVRSESLSQRATMAYAGSSANVIEFRDASYIILKWMTFSGMQDSVDAIRIRSGHDLSIEENTFTNTGGLCVAANDSSTQNIQVLRNTGTNLKSTGFYFGCHDGTLCASTHLRFEGNFVNGVTTPFNSSATGYAIEVKLNSHGIIRDNTIYNTKGPGIAVYGSNQGAPPTIIEGNYVEGSQNDGGIVVLGGPAIVRNNVTVGNAYGGISCQNYAGRGLQQNIWIVHNTVLHNDDSGINVQSWSTGAGNVIAYNAIIPLSGTSALRPVTPAGTIVDNRTCGNACFVNGVAAPYDLWPAADGALLNAAGSGTEVWRPGDDFMGAPRGNAAAIGAFEKTSAPSTHLVGNGLPRPPRLPGEPLLAPPTNLQVFRQETNIKQIIRSSHDKDRKDKLPL